MKKILSVLLLSLFTLLPMQVQGQFVSYNQIENGKYEAVIYYSSTTGQKSTYELVVTVTNDVVTAIHFGNGGSVHSGFNMLQDILILVGNYHLVEIIMEI